MIHSALISVEHLKDNILNTELIILDASLTQNKYGEVVNPSRFGIPRSQYFDISNIFSDQNSPYPNMLIDPILFEEEVQKLGVNKSSQIVVYDSKGIYSSARAWWMFKIMGHDNVAVLNGGLPAWKKANYPLDQINHQHIKNGDFKACFNSTIAWDFHKTKLSVKNHSHCIIDARSQDRFLGHTKEPRPQTQSGHIPGSLNLHYSQLLNNGFLKPGKEIVQLFSALNIQNKKLIFSCGSGVTACILFLAGYLYLENEIAVYDGSWTEWGEIKQ